MLSNKFPLIGLFLMLCFTITAVAKSNLAVLLDIEGAIGPATKDYLHRALNEAAELDAEIVLIRMDTPGGLDLSMRDIIKDILASPVPVVTWVSPSGARAASAGTYILYASHVAAMSPATNLGAATPVSIGGDSPLSPIPKQDKDQNQKKAESDDAMSRKIVNDATAYIIGLAKLRGRNKAWAEQAVRGAKSLSAEAALKINVIDLIAKDQDDLFRKLNGRKVILAGKERVLQTLNIAIKEINPDWRSRFLAIITNPNIAYILMLIGVYGLFFEFSNPGSIIPGVAGAISLLLALFAFQVLPVNYAGLALIFLGIILIVSEAFVPSFGALGIGGIIATVAGSIILMESDIPGFRVSKVLIGSIALISSTLFALILFVVYRSMRKPVRTGKEYLLNASGTVIADFEREGWIRLHGENWKARSETPLQQGESVIVKGIDGLTLLVKPQIAIHTKEA